MIIEILLGIIIVVLIFGIAIIRGELESIENALALYMPKQERVSEDFREIRNLLMDIKDEFIYGEK